MTCSWPLYQSEQRRRAYPSLANSKHLMEPLAHFAACWPPQQGLPRRFTLVASLLGLTGFSTCLTTRTWRNGWRYVLRFDPATRNFKDIFVANDVCNCDFNRPEGLVFGPDGNLYVTSFQVSSSDTDRILIFAGPYSRKPGALLGKIDLDQVRQDRAYAQALLFGPEGRLFVPITGDYTGPYAGQVRRYNVNDLDHIWYDIFVPSGLIKNPGASWWYLTFGNTDPATLNYTNDRDE